MKFLADNIAHLDTYNRILFFFQGLTKPVISVKDLLTDRLITFLPETTRLDFALATPVVRDFKEYVKSLTVIKDTILYHGNSGL